MIIKQINYEIIGEGGDGTLELPFPESTKEVAIDVTELVIMTNLLACVITSPL